MLKSATFRLLWIYAILPLLSKVTKNVLTFKLHQHLYRLYILSKPQSRIRSDYGCSGVNLGIRDDIFQHVYCGGVSASILLDHPSAFDTIKHNLLLPILHFTGLEAVAAALESSYITGCSR